MIAALLTAYVPISPPRVPHYSCGRAQSVVLPRNSHRSLVLQAESGDEKKTFLNVLRDGYKEGYEAGQKYLSTPMRSSVTTRMPLHCVRPTRLRPSCSPWSSRDHRLWRRHFYCMADWHGSGIRRSTTSAAVCGRRRGRVLPCRDSATRLLAECVALPYVMRRIESRSTELRATYVKDRASQTIAVFGVLLLTLRAFNAGALSGTTGRRRRASRKGGQRQRSAWRSCW